MRLYKNIDDKIQCLLCPHLCVIKEGDVGKCHVRKNDGKEIKLINYGIINAMAVESIEKKPFRHFLSNSKTLSFSSPSKCNLSCLFCENHKISQSFDIKGKSFSIDNLINMAIEKHCQSISMSYNEPTLSYEFLIDLAEQCERSDLKFLLKTNAFVNEEPWKEICKVTDAMNIDLKAGTTENFRVITGCSQYIVKDRIKEAYESGVHLEISIPLYYKDDELEDEMKILGEFLSSINKEILCHLLSIQPSYKYSDFIFKSKNMKKAKDILSSYMANIYEVV